MLLRGRGSVRAVRTGYRRACDTARHRRRVAGARDQPAGAATRGPRAALLVGRRRPGSRAAGRAAASAIAARAAAPSRASASSRASGRWRYRRPGRDVWICRGRARPSAGHRPRRPRTQAVPLPRRAGATLRDATKFDRMLAFGDALPRLRDRIDARPRRCAGLPRERVLAAVVRLVDDTLIRVGSERVPARERLLRRDDDARAPRPGRRARASRFEFKGKCGKLTHAEVYRPPARTHVQRLHDLPGRELFEYLDDDGERQRVRSDDVNAYLQRGRAATDHRQGLPHLGRERPVHARARRARSAGLGGGGRPLDRRGGSRGRGRARQHPRGLPCVSTSIPRCSSRTRRAPCRRRPAAGCAAWIAGNPHCCASCGPSDRRVS